MFDSKSRRLTLSFIAVICASLSGLGCGDDASAQETSGSAATGTTEADAGAENQIALNDAEIVQVLRFLNAGEVEAGQMAQAKGSTDGVRDFGAMMVTAHQARNHALDALSQRLGLTPTDSPVSQKVQETNALTSRVLSTLSGVAFDRAYADSQVQAHGMSAFLGDAVLAPRAQAPELQQELVTARAAVQQHLQHAVTLQASLAP